MSVNLDLSQVATNQDQADVTINDATGQVDSALTESLTVTVDNTNALTITAAQLRRYNEIVLTDAGSPPTALVTITLPATKRGMFVVRNALSTYAADVKVTGQVADIPNLAVGDASVLHSDGIKARQVGGAGAAALFVKVDGTSVMTDALHIQKAGQDLYLDPTNSTVSKLRTDSLFWQFDLDIDGTPSGFAASATQLAPLVDDTLVLGDASLRWNSVIVGTGTSSFEGHVSIKNAKELRLYEPGSGNYSALKAQAQSGDITYTLPAADGSAGDELSTDGSGNLSWVTQPYDIGGSYGGIPTASLVVFRFIAVRAVNFPANFSGSQSEARVASTGTATFDVKKNGSSIGTIVFTSSSTATFTTSGGSAQSLAAGDQLDIVAPGSPDATLEDIYFTLKGTR